MKTKLFFLFAIILFKTSAQIGFDAHVITAGSDGPAGALALAAGDIDGDGYTDVVATFQTGKKISYFKNLDGNGTFARPIAIDNDLYTAAHVFLVDLDGDSDLDILVSSRRYEYSKIFWYENLDGLGYFGPKQQLFTHEFDDAGIALNFADIDNDGDMDIICATGGNNQSRWFENNNGVFTEHLIDSYDYNPTLISAVDINGDGNLDLVVGSYNAHTLYFYEGDGLGNFGAGTLIADELYSIRGLEFADIDNDGDLDAVALYNNRISWFENLDGNGTFGPPQRIQAHSGLGGFVLLDVDNDGDIDVAATNSTRNELIWYENVDGQGDFGPNQLIASSYDRPSRLITADLNSDGFEDVISVAPVDQTIDWFENIEGSGNFENRNTIFGITDGPYTTDTGDIDGDGLKDIVCAVNHDGDKIVWFKNLDNRGLFSPQIIVSTPQDGCNFVRLVDIDSDGDLDILATMGSGSSVKWFENDGQGNFVTEHVVESNNLGVVSAYFEDINGDGLKDIITFSTNYGVYWYENIDGMGQFGDRQVVNGTTPSNSFYLVDIDSDGDLDIVITASVNKVAWLENDGQGNFGTENVLETDLFYAYFVYSADVDNDGDNDLIVSDFEKIVWYENLDGLGNFGSENIIEDGYDADHMVMYDMDGDGHLDLVTSLWGLQKVVWYPNTDGLGNFGSRIEIGPCSLMFKVDDLNNDGDLDVIAPLYNDNKITWFENNLILGTGHNINIVDDLLLFPNPALNEISLKSLDKIIEVNIYNNLGQLVLSAKDSSGIDISSLDSGLYFVKVVDEKGNNAVKKMIKQ